MGHRSKGGDLEVYNIAIGTCSIQQAAKRVESATASPSIASPSSPLFDALIVDEATQAWSAVPKGSPVVVRQLGANFSFAKNIRFGTSVNRDMERFGGINFDKTRYSTNLFVNTFNTLSVGGFFSYGDQVFFGTAPFLGSGSQGRVFLTVRPLNRLQSQINITTSRLIDPLDETEVFDVKIYRALTTYQFTDRLLLRNILEYNTFSKTVGANVLFTYRVNSGTVFFIGYDDRYQQGDLILDDGNDPAYFGNQELFTTDLVRTNRAFFTKISYLFRY